jgi:hypothetical protein
VQGLFKWYFTRIYVHVRPERVFVWPGGDFGQDPQLYDCHIDEVRSGRSEEPEVAPAAPVGGPVPWDDRMRELGRRHETAVMTVVAPDGFPMSARVPVEPDEPAGRIRLGETPVGIPLHPGRACLVAHEHHPDFRWQVNFQLRGNLLPDDSGWAIVPHKVIGGFELPPTSALARYRLNARKMMRFRKIAKQQLQKRTSRA